MHRLPFEEVWCVDFEFRCPSGARSTPRCMVARELRSGRLLRYWADELYRMDAAPFRVDENALFIAFFASAEFSCFLALGWDMPKRVLDLYVERRRITNGRGRVPAKCGLTASLRAYGLDAIDADEKQTMRNLASRGGDFYDRAEREALLVYCQSDVDGLRDLLPAMLPDILTGPSSQERVLGQALLRGRYMVAVARMEYAGVPIDTATLSALRDGWDGLRLALVEKVDSQFRVYDGTVFKAARFESYLAGRSIPWPRLGSGSLDLKDDTFRQMARAYPGIAPLHELRHSLGQMKLNKLAVGADGRNRTLLSPFAAKTGRNQPSNSRFIFGPSRWLRGLIKPPRGCAFVYADFCNQELAIAGALSGDPGLIDSYKGGDPYLDFGKRAGILPPDATKDTHTAKRQMLKSAVLGINYGMQEHTLSGRLGVTALEARLLIRKHKEAYPDFWSWSGEICDRAMLTLQLPTELGWTLSLDAMSQTNPRSLMNFPMQANGAEMLRLACCLATEDGLEVVAPVHDALALVAPLDVVDDHTERLSGHMKAASEIVLGGFQIRVEIEKTVRYPDRYRDEAGGDMWDLVTGMLP